MEQAGQNSQPMEDLREIRSIMERSSRFISLSGLSGVFVGIFALIGEYIAISHFQLKLIDRTFYSGAALRNLYFNQGNSATSIEGFHLINGTLYHDFFYFVIVAVIVLICSLGTAVGLSWRRANRNGTGIWSNSARRLVINLFVPLIAGGIFCLALLYQHIFELIIPATLIFYGVALFNAGKYTLNDIRYLGLIDIALGLFVCFRLQYSLLMWGFGFGIFHIVYGIIMYYKYER